MPFLFWQDCIPVECVPPACYPYLPACTALGGCLVPGGGADAWFGEGVPVSGPGGCVCIPACNGADPTPMWTESQTRVKTKPCPNFVAGGKNIFSFPCCRPASVIYTGCSRFCKEFVSCWSDSATEPRPSRRHRQISTQSVCVDNTE